MTQSMVSQSGGEAADRAEVFEALVVEVHEHGRVSLRRADGAGTAFEARSAVHGYCATSGDRVLCTAGSRGVYVTGVLMAPPPELRAGGARAAVEAGELVVRGADGTIVLRYDAETGVIRVSSANTVIEATDRLELKGKEVSVEAERLVQRVGALVTEAESIATSVDRWELRANRITERARNVFRDVEALLQTRAGTLRSIAREGMSLFANRTTIRSKKDTAVDGERVLLG
jgi:hypothetical protein